MMLLLRFGSTDCPITLSTISSNSSSKLEQKLGIGYGTVPNSSGDAVRAKRRRDLMLDDEVLEIASWEARRYTTLYVALYYAAGFLSLGLVFLVSQWPWGKKAAARGMTVLCAESHADLIIVENKDGTFEVCEVEVIAERQLELLASRSERAVRRSALRAEGATFHKMVVYRHTRFLFDAEAKRYRQLDPEKLVDSVPLSSLLSGGGGTRGGGGGSSSGVLTLADAATRLGVMGRNIIDVPVPAWHILLLREAMHPFVIFQVWAIGVWLSAQYYPYSAFIFATASATTFLNFWEVRKNLLSTQKLARYAAPVTVVRRGADSGGAGGGAGGYTLTRVVVDSSDLVPGDIIELDNGQRLPCDCVLLEGSATVNEAMLTGESTVVIKSPLPRGATAVSPAAEARNTLFGGSMVVQLRVPPGSRVRALVVRTGFETVKGRLVLSIMYPRPSPFKFVRQSYIFIGALGVIALAGFAFNANTMANFGASGQRIFQRGCDMVTIVVPPALPLALTVGVAAALVSLRRQKVFCISPPRINLAGKINAFCFDKTGTLTSEGLDLAAVVPAARGMFGAPAVTRNELGDHPIVRCMATCHSLTHVEGALAGDPLEQQTFAFTRGVLTEPHYHAPAAAAPKIDDDDGSTAALRAVGSGPRADEVCHVALPAGGGSVPWSASVVAQFEFVPQLQRMSVLIRETSTPSGAPLPPGVVTPLIALVKGSPECITALCRADTVPPDAEAVLRLYTRRGFRVIAAGAKLYDGPDPASSPAETVRASVETGLAFLGLIVLENGLKPETAPTLATLREQTGMPLVMVTGDNPVSAVCVARDCGLVEAGVRVFLGDLRVPPPAAAAAAGEHNHHGAASAAAVASASAALSSVMQQQQAGGSGGAHNASALSHSGPNFNLGSAARREDAIEWVDVDSDASFNSSAVAAATAAADLAAAEAGAAPGSPTKSSVPPGSAPPSLSPALSTLDPRTLLPRDGSGGTPYRLALTGRAFRHLLAVHRDARAAEAGEAITAARAGAPPPASSTHPSPTLLTRALGNAAVFARMAPEDKSALVEELAGMGYYVGMCGDGANDSLALRAAHVGISLSQVEASVSAPFTSSVPNISCVPVVLREGRGALTTAFNLFLFMALYSTIQFANALFAISVNSILSNNQYLYQDLFIVFIISLSLGATPAAARLTRKRPSAELLSLYNLTLCAGFIALTFAAQTGVYIRVRYSPGYGLPPENPPPDPEGINSATPETTAVFLVAMFQYVGVATIFSLGHPWLRPPWYNRPFTTWIIIASAVSALVLLSQDTVTETQLSLLRRPDVWNEEILAWSAASVVSYVLFIAALAAAKRKGVFSAIVRWSRRTYVSGGCIASCRRRCGGYRAPRSSGDAAAAAAASGAHHSPAYPLEVLHKRVRREWEVQFAGGKAAARANSLADVIFKDRGEGGGRFGTKSAYLPSSSSSSRRDMIAVIMPSPLRSTPHAVGTAASSSASSSPQSSPSRSGSGGGGGDPRDIATEAAAGGVRFAPLRRAAGDVEEAEEAQRRVLNRGDSPVSQR